MTLLWGEMGLLCALNLEINSQICGVAFFQEIMLHAVFFYSIFVQSNVQAGSLDGIYVLLPIRKTSCAYTQNI